MSTAGKVLSVIVILAIVAWIFLASGVTQLNKEWAQKIEKLDEEIGGKPDERALGTGGLRGQIVKLEGELRETKAATVVEQTRTADAVTQLRAELSDVQRMQTSTSETLLRLQLEVANVQATLKSSQDTQKAREQEKADTEKLLADERALVESLKADVDERLATLDKLRKDFKAVLAESQQRLEQLRKRGTSEGRVRGASFIPSR